MAAGSTVADFTALEALTGVVDNEWYIVRSVRGRYTYDSAGTASANGDITRVHGEGGRWYADGSIYSENVPSGDAELPVTVNRKVSASGGGFTISTVYKNGGGGNSTWTTENFT